MGFFNKFFGFENNANYRSQKISTILSENHPAVMLYQLTRQCFTDENTVLVQCAKDIIEAAEQQYKIGDQFRERLNAFYIRYPEYKQRLKTHLIKHDGNIYTLGFILEIICISRSDLARKKLIESNFIFMTRIGELDLFPFINCDQQQINELDFDEKEELLFDAIDDLSDYLKNEDWEFIEHIKNLLLEINSYYSDLCLEHKGYDDFDYNESQYPAISSYLDTYEMVHSYRYNYSEELNTTYRCYFKDDETYNLRISFLLETLDFYIEMVTRYNVHMTIQHGYLKVYTRKYEFLNGNSFRNRIKEVKGDTYVEAMDKCIQTMCKSQK